jgi:hypothetical protein
MLNAQRSTLNAQHRMIRPRSSTGGYRFFLVSWFESLAVASHPLQPDSFLLRDGENV